MCAKRLELRCVLSATGSSTHRIASVERMMAWKYGMSAKVWSWSTRDMMWYVGSYHAKSEPVAAAAATSGTTSSRLGRGEESTAAETESGEGKGGEGGEGREEDWETSMPERSFSTDWSGEGAALPPHGFHHDVDIIVGASGGGGRLELELEEKNLGLLAFEEVGPPRAEKDGAAAEDKRKEEGDAGYDERDRARYTILEEDMGEERGDVTSIKVQNTLLDCVRGGGVHVSRV